MNQQFKQIFQEIEDPVYQSLLETFEELEAKGLGYWVQDEFVICRQDEKPIND